MHLLFMRVCVETVTRSRWRPRRCIRTTESVWSLTAAPEPGEVIWQNLRMRAWERQIRGIIMWLVFIAIIILYLPVCLAIQAAVNLDNAKKVPGLKTLVDLPFISQVVQGLLPGVLHHKLAR